MKKILSLLLCLLMALGLAAAAQASGFTITDSADALEETAQFPFQAETDEQAVNVRAEASTKAAKVGRLERGAQLTVTGAAVNGSGELWYAVELEDGAKGFIRSDLLVEASAAQAERAANPAPQTASTTQVIGNRNSKKYHETWCRSLPKEGNRVYFDSAEEAERKGYVHCKNCD